MKNLFLVGLALISFQSFSQSFASKLFDKLYFGVKAGGNYSNFVDAGFDTEGLAGFHAGAIVGFKITDKLLIQEEFLFSTQGAKIKDNSFGKQDLELSYLSVPILLKYHTNLGVYVEAGPQVNMLIKDFEDSGFGDFADKIDAGVALGLGYQFRVGPVKGLGVGARYYHGFTEVGKFNSSTVKPDFKNSSIQGSVFYIF